MESEGEYTISNGSNEDEDDEDSKTEPMLVQKRTSFAIFDEPSSKLTETDASERTGSMMEGENDFAETSISLFN